MSGITGPDGAELPCVAAVEDMTTGQFLAHMERRHTADLASNHGWGAADALENGATEAPPAVKHFIHAQLRSTWEVYHQRLHKTESGRGGHFHEDEVDWDDED